MRLLVAILKMHFSGGCTVEVEDGPESPPVWRAHHFYTQPRSYWKSFFFFFFFPQHYWRAIIFPSLVQHSIRLHVRWLWLMVVILFGHNVAVPGNWRWEPGWEIVIFNLYVLGEDWASALFCSHILTVCLHSVYSHGVDSQSLVLWQSVSSSGEVSFIAGRRV